MAKKEKQEEAKHSIEGTVSETYAYAEEKQMRLSIDGEQMRLETYVPIEFGETIKMGDKVTVTIEKA